MSQTPNITRFDLSFKSNVVGSSPPLPNESPETLKSMIVIGMMLRMITEKLDTP
jgi:hypothetical protein